jgi:sec-independent protein translocase protein TatA
LSCCIPIQIRRRECRSPDSKIKSSKAARVAAFFFGALLFAAAGVEFSRLDKFMNIMFASMLGGWQVILIVLIVVILFGGKKIPELAKGLGLGIKEFKKAAREVTDEVQKAGEETPAQQTKTAANGQSQPAQTVSQSPNPPKA